MAGTAAPVAPATKAVALPARSGDPSLIEHVVYIIKENRTYDQVFGDIGKGNSEPSLTMFGRDVTPNQHKLAEQFVLLDNFYATGGNSADGHQWATQANETAYCLWPGYEGRSYPYNGTDPLAYSSSGFLWDYALARGRTVRVYGEYAGALPDDQKTRHELLAGWRNGEKFRGRWNIKAPIAKLNTILAPYFPSYSQGIPDVVRAQLFLEDLEQWKKDGKMPNLSILLLPSDHTVGTRPGGSTPKAMVADNDLAVGQIVEGLSKSPFWKTAAPPFHARCMTSRSRRCARSRMSARYSKRSPPFRPERRDAAKRRPVVRSSRRRSPRRVLSIPARTCAASAELRPAEPAARHCPVRAGIRRCRRS